jgi:hypothetical protein
LSADWNAVSSPNSAAFSGAHDVHPIDRSNDAWNSASRSGSSSPSALPNAVASTQVRRPFSKATPDARSVVNDSAANTSATRILTIAAG